MFFSKQTTGQWRYEEKAEIKMERQRAKEMTNRDTLYCERMKKNASMEKKRNCFPF